MSEIDLFGFGSQALQDGLNRPGLSLASGVPKQSGHLLGAPMAEKGCIEGLLEEEAAPGDPSRIARLAPLPAVLISRLKPSGGIAGLAGLEFTACHGPPSELTCGVALPLGFETRPVWRGKRNRSC